MKEIHYFLNLGNEWSKYDDLIVDFLNRNVILRHIT